MHFKKITEWLRKFAPKTLFLLQLTMALVFGGSQFLRLLESTEGVRISWLLSWEIFLITNLVLSVRAHREEKKYSLRSRSISFQIVITYVVWSLVIGLNLLTLLLNPKASWVSLDSWTMGLSALGVFGILYYSRRKGKHGLSDPRALGGIAICSKTIPQLTLALSIYLYGSRGVSLGALAAGHLSIFCRLLQLRHSIKDSPGEKNRFYSALSEGANEVSWILVTVVWALR